MIKYFKQLKGVDAPPLGKVRLWWDEDSGDYKDAIRIWWRFYFVGVYEE